MKHASVVRIAVRALLCLPWLFGMTGYAQESPAPLQVATNIWPGYESLYLARGLGYYPKSSVLFHEMTNATDVLLPPAKRLADVMSRGKLVSKPVDSTRLIVRSP